MPLWKKDPERRNAQEIIDWILRQKHGNGFRLSFPFRIAISELVASSPNSNLSEGMVLKVLQKMSASGKNTIDDFESLYKQTVQENDAIAPKNTARWRFFIPIEIVLDSDISLQPRLQILGTRFSLLTLESVLHQLDKKSRITLLDLGTLRLLTHSAIERIPDVFLFVNGYGDSWKVAWKDIDPAFNTLRGLFEFSLNLGLWTIISSGKERARRVIPHPLWMLASKGREETEWIYFDTEEGGTGEPYLLQRQPYQLSNETLAAIKEHGRFLSKTPKPNSTLSRISDCLRLYAQAMDARFNHVCFLGLWQLAEAITNSEISGGETDRVIARLAWHGEKRGLAGSGFKYTLKSFSILRNKIVHRGIHEVEEIHISILKLACEAALLWLIDVYKSLPTLAHIEQFYSLRTENEAKFTSIEVNHAVTKATINHIKHTRSRKS